MTLFIGITGPCGSGKSYMSAHLAESLEKNNIRCEVIVSDHYYKDIGPLSKEDMKKINFCSPDAIDFLLLEKHLALLKNGCSIDRPKYDMKSASRKKETVKIEPAEVIIIEGLLILSSQYIKELCQLKIFLEFPLDLCLARRLFRDHHERELAYDFVLGTYEKFIRPSYLKYTSPQAHSVQLKLINYDEVRNAISIISNCISRKKNSRVVMPQYGLFQRQQQNASNDNTRVHYPLMSNL